MSEENRLCNEYEWIATDLDMVVERFSPMLVAVEVARPRPGSPAAPCCCLLLRMLSMPCGLTACWPGAVAATWLLAGGGEGDPPSHSGAGPGDTAALVAAWAWLSIAAAFMSVIVCSADRGPGQHNMIVMASECLL